MSEGLSQAAIALATASILLIATACMIGPKYQRPAAAAPPAFKEAPPAGWSEAHPNDGAPRGRWWTVYGDPRLDALEDRVNISNQNVLAAEARFREAVASVRVTRAALFPTVIATPSSSLTARS